MQCACTTLYSHLWPARLYNILPLYLIRGTIFRKKLLNKECVFCFFLQLLSETFLILRRIQRDITNAHRTSCKVPVILVRSEWSLNFLGRFSKNTAYHENSSSESRVVPCGQTDRRTDTTKVIVTFLSFANRLVPTFFTDFGEVSIFREPQFDLQLKLRTAD